MNKLNVLFIYPGPTYYAKHKIFQYKYELLSKFLNGNILTSSSESEKIQIGGFLYHSIASSRRLNSVKFFIFCLKSAFDLRKNNKIDCIVTYDPLVTGFIGYILSFILKSKIIVEVNGDYSSPIVWADDRIGILTNIKRLFATMLMSFILFVSDGVKLLYPSQLDTFKVLRNKKEIVVFPDWVPVSYFKNLGETKEILFVGFPFYIKGVDVLVESFKRIASSFPDWKLKIMGWYPDLNALDKAIDGHSQIYFHTPVPYYDVPKHVGECGIFVLPSRSEAMGRVLLESAAAGKPRIGSDVGGIPTVINDGVDGFLFESENVDDLAEKMSVLMANSALRKKIGGCASKRINVDFSEEKYIDNLLSFINKVVEK